MITLFHYRKLGIEVQEVNGVLPDEGSDYEKQAKVILSFLFTCIPGGTFKALARLLGISYVDFRDICDKADTDLDHA
jgi:diacylglycerol kinase family enzyme